MVRAGPGGLLRPARLAAWGVLGGRAVSPLPREQHAELTASAGVSDVTGYIQTIPLFFGQRVISLSI
jgi:hypothetical protein